MTIVTFSGVTLLSASSAASDLESMIASLPLVTAPVSHPHTPTSVTHSEPPSSAIPTIDAPELLAHIHLTSKVTVFIFTVTSVPIICPSSVLSLLVSLSSALSLSWALLVCPAVKAYILVTMGLNLMKLSENVVI